jgi:enoyl-CoA hydratase/carnithine racemase
MENPAEGKITTQARGHVFLMGIDRARKMNAFDLPMLRSLMAAFTEYEKNDAYRCAVLFAHGDHFTAGIDLASVKAEHFVPPAGMIDPTGIYGQMRSKPVIIAIHGRCLTIGIELALASDICIAAENARFGQIEVKRGIYPISGATLRMVPMMGWGNAMRYLLTGDEFDAKEAYRVGLVQEITPVGQDLERAIAIAETIAAQAPLAVQATLASARQAVLEGQLAASKSLIPKFNELAQSEDAKEGVRSFIERRTARFTGR